MILSNIGLAQSLKDDTYFIILTFLILIAPGYEARPKIPLYMHDFRSILVFFGTTMKDNKLVCCFKKRLR